MHIASEDIGKVKFRYLRDPHSIRRVITVGFLIKDDTVLFNAIVNKVVANFEVELDPRLQKLMGRQEHKDLRNALRKKYGGDQFCKKQGRSILKGRLRGKAYAIPYRKDRVLSDMLATLADFNGPSPLMSKHAYEIIHHCCGCNPYNQDTDKAIYEGLDEIKKEIARLEIMRRDAKNAIRARAQKAHDEGEKAD